MTTKAQAIAELAKLGFELDEAVTGFSRNMGFEATFDPIGRTSIAGECRGERVASFTAGASEFWAEVVDRARAAAPFLEPCPHPVGECEMHDELGDG